MPPAIVALLFFTGLFAASMICAIFVGLDTALKYAAGVAIIAIVVSARRQIGIALSAFAPVVVSAFTRIKDLGAIELIPRESNLPAYESETDAIEPTKSNSLTGTNKPRKPRLIPCPACDHIVSDGAMSCPNCGQVVNKVISGTIKTGHFQDPESSAAPIAGIIATIVGGIFILVCFSCMGAIRNLPTAPQHYRSYYAPSTPRFPDPSALPTGPIPNRSYYGEVDRLNSEYRRKQDKLDEITREIITDPYTTDAEFVDRLRRIDEIK